MPQLDFTWWVIKFFLIWSTILITAIMIAKTRSTPQMEQTNSTTNISKKESQWQWL